MKAFNDTPNQVRVFYPTLINKTGSNQIDEQLWGNEPDIPEWKYEKPKLDLEKLDLSVTFVNTNFTCACCNAKCKGFKITLKEWPGRPKAILLSPAHFKTWFDAYEEKMPELAKLVCHLSFGKILT